jgi:hypothetical protein
MWIKLVPAALMAACLAGWSLPAAAQRDSNSGDSAHMAGNSSPKAVAGTGSRLSSPAVWWPVTNHSGAGGTPAVTATNPSHRSVGRLPPPTSPPMQLQH